MTWKARVAVVVGVLLGGFAVATASFAAPPLPSANAGEGVGGGTALGVPGVLTVSESKATEGGHEGGNVAEWSAVSIAGQSLIGRGRNGSWTGPGAPAGGLVDSVNEQLCPTSGVVIPIPSAPTLACVSLLNSYAETEPPYGPLAGGSLLLVGVVSYTPQGTVDANARIIGSQGAASECQGQGDGYLSLGSVTTPAGAYSLDLLHEGRRTSHCAD